MAATEQATGIFQMDAAAYHSDPCGAPSLSASIAHVLYEQTPRHAWFAHPRLNPDFERKDEAKFDLGTCAHALLLEQREVEDVVAIIDANDFKTNAAKEARDAARAAGKIPLLSKHVDRVTAMLDATKAQLDAYELAPAPFTNGKAEQCLIWEEDGVVCRSLVDWLHDDFTTIDDFKTTSASADPRRWARTLLTIGADVQAAFHARGVEKLTGVRPRMRYVVQETYAPYALSVVALGADLLALGEAKVEYAITRWRECIETDEWPAYATEVVSAAMPAWAEAEFLQITAREDE